MNRLERLCLPFSRGGIAWVAMGVPIGVDTGCLVASRVPQNRLIATKSRNQHSGERIGRDLLWAIDG